MPIKHYYRYCQVPDSDTSVFIRLFNVMICDVSRAENAHHVKEPSPIQFNFFQMNNFIRLDNFIEIKIFLCLFFNSSSVNFVASLLIVSKNVIHILDDTITSGLLVIFYYTTAVLTLMALLYKWCSPEKFGKFSNQYYSLFWWLNM